MHAKITHDSLCVDKSESLLLGHILIAPGKMDWRPHVVSGPVPEASHFHNAPVAAYVSLNDYAGNFGHALYVRMLCLRTAWLSSCLERSCSCSKHFQMWVHRQDSQQLPIWHGCADLQDFLFPLFNTLDVMGAYQPDFQLILAQHQVQLFTCFACQAWQTIGS